MQAIVQLLAYSLSSEIENADLVLNLETVWFVQCHWDLTALATAINSRDEAGLRGECIDVR